MKVRMKEGKYETITKEGGKEPTEKSRQSGLTDAVNAFLVDEKNTEGAASVWIERSVGERKR